LGDTAYSSMTGFPEWTFVDSEVLSTRTCMAWWGRKVAPTTSDITEMMYFVASDTCFVGWRSRARYVLGYTLNSKFP